MKDESGRQLIRHGEDEAERLKRRIEEARARLAEAEAGCTVAQKKITALRASIFVRLGARNRLRDKLRLLVRYRADYLASLRAKDERQAEEAQTRFEAEQERTEREYQAADAEAARQRSPLSQDDENEIASLWRKLVKLYHPDKLGENAEKRELHHRLIAAINHARDAGHLALLREIAADPQGFIARKGWGDLDVQEERFTEDLLRLLQTLEAEIEKAERLLRQLLATSDYELHLLVQENPAKLDEIVDKQLKQLEMEITVLEAQAASLRVEIEAITGEPLNDWEE